MIIRPERPEDRDAARRVLVEAFGRPAEASLVDDLRAAGAQVPELCLVAIAGGALAGIVYFSVARLASGHDVLALAPLAVAPAHQRRGIGARLTETALDRAEHTDYPLVVLLGHPTYYPRFGFEPAAPQGIVAPWDVPSDAWMIRRLPAYDSSAKGLVTFPPAFDAVS